MKRYLLLICTISLLGAASVGAQDFEYTVRHRHILKDCRGTLRINEKGVEFKATSPKDSRSWTFERIQTLEIESPDRISIITYEDQKRFVGKDRRFEFTLLNKHATPDLSAFLLAHVKRPMELAVLPQDSEKPAFELPVKHLHTISGTTGVLRIYPDRIVYESDKQGDSRYWRLKDIQRFSQPDRFRFQIVGYEPSSEVFNFELMQDLPDGLYDYLWVRLHPSSYYPAIQ